MAAKWAYKNIWNILLDFHINSQTRTQTIAFARCSWEYAQQYCIIEGQWKLALT